VKFLVDMPLSPSLARWLVDQGHNAVHASDVGLERSSDMEIIAHARADGRTAITADLDYPRLLAISGTTQPALIVFRGGTWSDSGVLRRMSDLLGSLTEPDIEQSVLVIEQTRLRRRRLPIGTS
jgi:predicted nuclease of predicted toxin-antitoxin system